MRPCHLLMVVALAPAAGCSAFVAASGTDLAKLKTRDEVRQKLGEPVAVGSADGVAYEEFRTRRKIADHSVGIYICMYDVATLGLMELYFLPHELFVASRGSLLGQTFRVEYDVAGGVRGIKDRDGHWVFGCGPPRPSSEPPGAEDDPP